MEYSSISFTDHSKLPADTVPPPEMAPELSEKNQTENIESAPVDTGSTGTTSPVSSSENQVDFYA